MAFGVLNGAGGCVPQGGAASPASPTSACTACSTTGAAAHDAKRIAGGDKIIVRHADDFVCGFRHENDAKRIFQDPGERLARFGRELRPD